MPDYRANHYRMISDVSLAELASTDEMIQIMVRKKLISDQVIASVYSAIGSKSAHQMQRSALILFAMIGKADRSVVEQSLDGLIKYGLGDVGRKDPLVAQYCCQAVQSLSCVQDDTVFRLPNDNILFSRLSDFIKLHCNSPEW